MRHRESECVSVYVIEGGREGIESMSEGVSDGIGELYVRKGLYEQESVRQLLTLCLVVQ